MRRAWIQDKQERHGVAKWRVQVCWRHSYSCFKKESKQCCQTPHTWDPRPKGCYSAMPVQWWQGHLLITRAGTPSFLISDDWTGLCKKNIQLDYFHKKASFLEDCLDSAPLWWLSYSLSAGSCRLDLCFIFEDTVLLLIHSTNVWVLPMCPVLFPELGYSSKGDNKVPDIWKLTF